MAEEGTSKKGCAKKRSKKDPIAAAARTAANKKRNLATEAKRKLAKVKKTYRWALRQDMGASIYAATTCREIRRAVRRQHKRKAMASG